MRTNLSQKQLDDIALTANTIREWIYKYDTPEKYSGVKNLELVINFVHTLDLLETVLTRFEICVQLSKLAIEEFKNPAREGSLGWKFWQIDVEEFFASNILELCYQLSNAWKKLQGFADENNSFIILKTKYTKPSDTLIARHEATHFDPSGFQNNRIANQYSILRRPYIVQGDQIKKELAKQTMPKVANYVKGALQEGVEYIGKFLEAITG